MEGFSGLKVDGAVFYLDQHVVAKLSVEWFELIHRLFGPIVGNVVVVHKGTPHHDSAKRLQGIGQYIGSIGVRPVVVLRSGLSLRIGLYQESTEIRDDGIDLLNLLFPPFLNGRIQGVSGF